MNNYAKRLGVYVIIRIRHM